MMRRLISLAAPPVFIFTWSETPGIGELALLVVVVVVLLLVVMCCILLLEDI